MKQINVCVLEYPESGDQAQVYFIDYTGLSQDSDPDCVKYAAAIAAALKDKNKMTSIPYEDGCCCGDYQTKMSTYQLKLPCQIDKAVTIYLD